MNTSPLGPARSERGVALIIVLLLLAVMSGVATGMAVNSQIEIAMSTNEAYYAGARAAAEAGMNRAIEAITADTTTDLLAGQDGVVDLVTPGAAVNADNGKIDFRFTTGTSPYDLGTRGQYTYTIQLFDDDDPALYTTALTADQLVSMGEDGIAYKNLNGRLILRATGFGPNGTTVRLARVIETVGTTTTTTTTATTITNPAILVDGDLTISGNPNIMGANGSAHANGDLAISGMSTTVAVNATAAGDFSANAGWSAGGAQGGGAPTLNVPTVNAADYFPYATHILTADGVLQALDNPDTVADETDSCVAPCDGWSHSVASGWSLTGSSAPTGTFFAYGSVSVSGTRDGRDLPGGSPGDPLPLSIISTGSISVTGNSTLQPENAAALQFVTDGDLVLVGNLDAEQTSVEGQSLVKEQLNISGNPAVRGQIIVKNAANHFGEATSNTISGNPDFTYDGSFGDMAPEEEIINPTTYLNNVSGWIETDG